MHGGKPKQKFMFQRLEKPIRWRSLKIQLSAAPDAKQPEQDNNRHAYAEARGLDRHAIW